MSNIKLPKGLIVNKDAVMQGNGWDMNNDLFGYDDFFEYDSHKDEDECKHEWKRVMGINRYYVICKHCEKRNEEEEKKQWE